MAQGNGRRAVVIEVRDVVVGFGDHLVLAPDGPEARVRSVEVHDESLERAGPGQRVAASLVGVEHGQARRESAKLRKIRTAPNCPSSFEMSP